MTAVDLDRLLTVSVDEAAARICSGLVRPKIEEIRLVDAVRRIMTEDFFTPFPMPPFRRSAMDGYAIRARSSLAAAPDQPVLLRIVGEYKAGMKDDPMSSAELIADEAIAVRIFTGAPVPGGFDTVVVQEAVKRVTDPQGVPYIQLTQPCTIGRHVAEAGEDSPSREKILHGGIRIGARETAVLASYGIEKVTVYEKPVVAIVPVGDELLKPGEPLQPYHIYDANALAAHAFVSQLGAEAIRFDPVSDHVEDISSAIKCAMEKAHMVITTGGISVGDYDFVAQAAEQILYKPLFTKVLMRPGSPTSAFSNGSRVVISLSGNPSACYAGLELLAKPAIQKLMGQRQYNHAWMEGRLTAAVHKPCPYPRYIRSSACWEGGAFQITPLTNDKSGNIAAFAETNAIAEIPAGGRGAQAGQLVKFFSLD